MKFILRGPFKENIYGLMRKAGYYFQKKDEEKGELIFVRPPKGYPRFHLYLKTDKESNEIISRLHLDQKQPVYKGTTAHSGDYEGEALEKEAEKIKQLLKL